MQSEEADCELVGTEKSVEAPNFQKHEGVPVAKSAEESLCPPGRGSRKVSMVKHGQKIPLSLEGACPQGDTLG